MGLGARVRAMGRANLVEVSGGHHREEMVLRLQRDVAGEHLVRVRVRVSGQGQGQGKG